MYNNENLNCEMCGKFLGYETKMVKKKKYCKKCLKKMFPEEKPVTEQEALDWVDAPIDIDKD